MANLTTYTDEQVANALALLRANGGNAKRTATQLGISRSTLRGWAGRLDNKTGHSKEVPPALVDEQAHEMAIGLDVLAGRIRDKVAAALDGVPITKASEIRDLLVSLGITIEKASFARGGPTSRTASVTVSLVAGPSLQERSRAELRVLDVVPALTDGRRADDVVGMEDTRG